MREFARRFSRNRPAVTGLAILLGVIAIALLAPLLYPGSPFALVGQPFQPPLGLLATTIAVLFGSTIGGLAGYYGGRIDALLMRFTEMFQTIPFFLFAIVLVAVLSPTIATEIGRAHV